MTKMLVEIIRDADTLLSLEPEELAGVVLAVLGSQLEDRQDNRFHAWNFANDVFLPGQEQYPLDHKDEIQHALMEAWGWLVREGLLAQVPRPGAEGWFFITRRGRRLEAAEDFQLYQKGSLLPKALLHPVIAEKVWLTFLRGDHDTAVFQAFKEVEVAVRAAAGFAPTDIGVPLMRKAFDPDTGPLTDPNLPKPERDALAHLFAGTIGSHKNPQSHRTVAISDPIEAVEMIILASHLLRIVEARSGPRQS